MRKIRVDKISGKEVLARDIYNDSGVIIIPQGTILKKDYAKKLRDIHIMELFVMDDISEDISEEDYTESQISEMCSDILKNTIERFSYASDGEVGHLVDVAEGVMSSVIQRKEVLYNVTAVRRKDQALSDHCLSVAALSVLTALKVDFSEEQAKEIAVGALLHDMGFLQIKTEYRDVSLDDTEESVAKEIKRHVVYGYMSVEKESWISPIAKDIILYHHERLDGSGYPFGLKGRKIKPEVRIVAICDTFDNMIYGTLCKKMKVYESMEYITAMAGTLFDEEYARSFVSSIAAYPVGSIVKLSNDSNGIVIRQNNAAPTRPVLKELKKNSNDEWEKGRELDMTKELTLFIVDTIE